MLKLQEACRIVIKGFDFNNLKYGSRQYSVKEKELLSKVLFTEKEVFRIYLKTGKYCERSFPFEMMKSNHLIKKVEMEEIGKELIKTGWRPETHVTLTRKSFENISYIGKTLTF